MADHDEYREAEIAKTQPEAPKEQEDTEEQAPKRKRKYSNK